MKNAPLLFVALILLLPACASNPHKAQSLETKIEKAQPVSAGYDIGIKKDEMIIQKKSQVAEDLRALQYEVHTLEDRTYGGDRYFGNPGVWGALNACRLRLASVENGGPGKMSYIEPHEYVIPEQEIGKIGLDEEGELISVTEEYLLDRIKRYRAYRQVLMARNRLLSDKFEMCRLDFEAQRQKKTPESLAVAPVVSVPLDLGADHHDAP